MTYWKNWRSKLAVLAAAVTMATMAVAQDSGPAQLVDLKLKDADLLAATQVLSRQTGLQFVIEPTDNPFKKIELSLNRVTAEEAIRYICQAAGAWAERDENGVYIIRQGKPPVKAEGNSSNVVVPDAKKPIVYRKIKILRADPKMIYDIITKEVTFDPLEGFRELNAAAALTRPGTSSYPTSQVIVAGASQFAPIAQPQSNMTQQPVQAPISEGAGNGVLLPGEASAQGGGLGAPGGGGQPGGGLGQNNQQGTGNFVGGQGLVPNGIEKVIYDPTDNSLYVIGEDDAVNRLRRIIADFDNAPKQILIKVEFVTTSQGASQSLGFDWFYQRGTVITGNRPGTFARQSDPIFLNYAFGNITSRLRTLLTSGQGKVVNAPILRTLNNQVAVVQQQVITTIFVTTVQNGPGGIVTSVNPVALPVNTFLIVRPRINEGDRTVTMNLTPQIGDFGQLRRGPNGEEIPDQLFQSINVVARVKDTETIVLGGLTRKSDQSSQSRFPILGDLPIVGQFFRSTTREKNNSELLIFVTPTIIEDENMVGTP